VLAPDAVRPRVRAAGGRRRRGRAPVVLLVGTLGGSKETSARSPAAARRRGPSTSSITDEAARRPRCSSPPGRRPSSSPTRALDRSTEYEVVQGSRTVAEVENVTDGLTKRFSLTLQPAATPCAAPAPSTRTAR
jgi:hypothetical protein